MTLENTISFFSSSFIATVLLTPLCWRMLRKYGFWNALDSHRKNQVVRGGGIALIIAFVVCGYLLSFTIDSSCLQKLNNLVPAIIILAVTGLIDDKFGLTARPKLILQALAIIALWWFDFRILSFLGFALNWYFSLGLTLLWGLAILNAFNLIDGLDGLCTGLALINSVALWGMAWGVGNVLIECFSLLLSGVCVAFLLFNFHPAKLFLGDVGSLFLGLVCAALSLSVTDGNFTIHNTSVLLLIFWIPFCDLGLAVWRRKIKAMLKKSGCQIMGRDMYHLHYRLLNITQNHRRTVELIWLCALGIDISAAIIFFKQSVLLTIAIFTVISLISLATFAQYELKYSYCYLKYAFGRLQKRYR